MTKRQEIENVIQVLPLPKDDAIKDAITFLREYQATLPPDKEPWEVAYRKLHRTTLESDILIYPNGCVFNEEVANFRDGYLARDAEKQEGK